MIDTGSIILPNVRIGNNVIVAAGSIITKDIPDNSVAGGVPARVIGSFDSFVVKRKSYSETKPETVDEIWQQFFKSRGINSSYL